MIRRSRSSTRRAGVTAPRPGSARLASRKGWASGLRNAWDSYHLAAHCVNGLDLSGRNARSSGSPASGRGEGHMARTPLLRAFARLAEEHLTAERLGVPTAELRGQRDEAAFDRGTFLKRAGVVGAGAIALPAAAMAAPARGATSARIAIVG